MKYIVGGIVLAAVIIGIVLWLRGAPQTTRVEPSSPPPALTVPIEGAPTSESDSIPTKQPTTTNPPKNTMNIETTTQGTGPAIVNGQVAVMEYTGMLEDGSVFDATSKHGGVPLEFTLGAGMVIKGWDQGVLGMKVGEERTLTIPSELGYGPNGYPPVIPGGATLIFTVKLVAIK